MASGILKVTSSSVLQIKAGRDCVELNSLTASTGWNQVLHSAVVPALSPLWNWTLRNRVSVRAGEVG